MYEQHSMSTLEQSTNKITKTSFKDDIFFCQQNYIITRRYLSATT